MRSLLLTCAALFVVVACATALAAQASSPRAIELTEAGGATFPERAFVIGLSHPRASLAAADVVVTENGERVPGVRLVPARAATRQTFGTVLLLDASESMVGSPIAAATEAARSFAAHRAPNQLLAVIAFNSASHVVLPFTTSKEKIDAALATPPPVVYGTHIYDAVDTAVSMLSSAGVEAGSIVVLSDGADTGSRASEKAVAARARAGHVRLFAVGFRDARFNGSALEALSGNGGGEYASADSPRGLSALFDALGSRLAREYLLRYKSLAGPNAHVRVRVSVDRAGAASAEYRTPALRVSAPPPYRASLASRVLGSWIAMLMVALLGACAVGLLATTLLEPQRSGLPRRMAEFVSVPGLQTHAAAPHAATESPGMLERLATQLEIARVNVSAGMLLGGTAAATVAAVVLLAFVLGSPWYGLLGLTVPLFVREYVMRKLSRRRAQFAEQLPDSLQVIAAALRAGHSFAGALAVVVERASEPMRSEMQTVVADEQLGIPIEQSISVVVKRMQNRDLEQVALVAQLQRDSGGNAAEVVERVAETIRERFELGRLVKTLTVQGRMSRWIVTALPVLLVLMLTLINPHYMHPLVSNLFGKVLIVLAAMLVVGGSFVIKRIVDIKV